MFPYYGLIWQTSATWRISVIWQNSVMLPYDRFPSYDRILNPWTDFALTCCASDVNYTFRLINFWDALSCKNAPLLVMSVMSFFCHLGRISVIRQQVSVIWQNYVIFFRHMTEFGLQSLHLFRHMTEIWLIFAWPFSVIWQKFHFKTVQWFSNLVQRKFWGCAGVASRISSCCWVLIDPLDFARGVPRSKSEIPRAGP